MDKEEQLLTDSMNLYTEEDINKITEEMLQQFLDKTASPQLAFIQTNEECAACC